MQDFLQDDKNFREEPIFLNRFKENINQFKLIYNQNYISILPEDETFLGMEAKIINEKFTEIQESYQKTFDKLLEENTSLNIIFKHNMEKYMLQDKKNLRINHLIRKIEIKKSVNNRESMNNNIMGQLNDSNKKLKNILKAFMTGKVSIKNETIEEINNKKQEKEQNLLKEKYELFGIIKNIVNNPENKNLIDENILHGIDYLEDSLFPDIKEIKEKEKQKLSLDIEFINNTPGNEEENFQSPCFPREHSPKNLNENIQNSQNVKIFENNNCDLININDINSSSGTNKNLDSQNSNSKNFDGEKVSPYGKYKFYLF